MKQYWIPQASSAQGGIILFPKRGEFGADFTLLGLLAGGLSLYVHVPNVWDTIL